MTQGAPGIPQALGGITQGGVLDLAADGFEVDEGFTAQLQHALFHRQVAVQVAQPAQTCALEVTLQRA
ncbi:hypothetical protein D3C84_1183110 [compost metagenome]